MPAARPKLHPCATGWTPGPTPSTRCNHTARNAMSGSPDGHNATVGTRWWSDLGKFEADAARADENTLRGMLRWAAEHEQSADQRGTGRNPKARRMFRQFRKVAEVELNRRGLA